MEQATEALASRSAQLEVLQDSLETQSGEVAAKQAALEERETALAAARRAAAELESTNSALVGRWRRREARSCVGREGRSRQEGVPDGEWAAWLG